jgi:hypothetical protein
MPNRWALSWLTDRRSGLMENYEIRIVKKGHSAPFIYACPHTNDYAAVRKARSLVDAGDAVEVWRGLDCVYSFKPEVNALH